MASILSSSEYSFNLFAVVRRCSVKKVFLKISKISYKKTFDRKKQLHECFKNYQNITTTLIRISEEKFYKSFLEENKKDSRKGWEGIRSIINLKNGKFSINISLNIDNETITDDLTIRNQFNNFLTSVAKNLVTKIPKRLKSIDSYLKNANENSVFMSPTTHKDVEDILCTLKTHKSTGPDSIPTRTLKEYFPKSISDLTNLSFSSGVFPEIIK